MNTELYHVLIMGVYGEAHKHLYAELTGEFVPMTIQNNQCFYWREIEMTKSSQINVSLLTSTNADQILSTLKTTPPNLVIITGEHINNTTFLNVLLSVLRYSSCSVLSLVSYADRLLKDFVTYPKSQANLDVDLDEYDMTTVFDKLTIKFPDPVFHPDTTQLFIERMKTIVQELRTSNKYVSQNSLPFDPTIKISQDHRLSFHVYCDMINTTLEKQIIAFPDLRKTFMTIDEVIDEVIERVNNEAKNPK